MHMCDHEYTRTVGSLNIDMSYLNGPSSEICSRVTRHGPHLTLCRLTPGSGLIDAPPATFTQEASSEGFQLNFLGRFGSSFQAAAPISGLFCAIRRRAGPKALLAPPHSSPCSRLLQAAISEDARAAQKDKSAFAIICTRATGTQGDADAAVKQ